MSDKTLTCRDCGASFTFTESEQRFFAEKKPQFGGKTLAQYLEQLHVAVRLREREGAALTRYLSKIA